MSQFGPKPKIEDPEQLRSLMRLKPTLKDCAHFFDVSEDTVERCIRKHWDLTFAEFREQNFVHTRMMLIRTAIQKAEKGDNCMLIFCLKNVCGWRDKWEEPTEDQRLKALSTPELIVLVKEKYPELTAATK